MIVQGGARGRPSEQRTGDRGKPGRLAEEGFAVAEALDVWARRERVAMREWLAAYGDVLTGGRS